ncbi:MAG: hypothetical protein R2799_01105 [Crocinitomicaceae bacterium]
METRKVVIDKLDLSNPTSRKLILNMIDDQIKDYKLQYLINWEKDHSLSSSETKNKIKALETKKEELKQLFSEKLPENTLGEISFTINLRPNKSFNSRQQRTVGV